MLTRGRPAALLLVALLLPGVLVAGCGTTPEPVLTEPTATRSTTPAARPESSAALRCAGGASAPAVPSYGASGFSGAPGDAPPHHAENHAFQRRLPLCGVDLDQGEAEAARAVAALDDLTSPTAAEVARVLEQLGHDPRETVISAEGREIRFAVMVAPACLDGVVGPDGPRVEPWGLYAEGGCVKPVGGH